MRPNSRTPSAGVPTDGRRGSAAAIGGRSAAAGGVGPPSLTGSMAAAHCPVFRDRQCRLSRAAVHRTTSQPPLPWVQP